MYEALEAIPNAIYTIGFAMSPWREREPQQRTEVWVQNRSIESSSLHGQSISIDDAYDRSVHAYLFSTWRVEFWIEGK